jgi:transcriptional regulator with XRE-family HTH domain
VKSEENSLHLDMARICVDSLNAKFSHKFYDYSDLPEDTFGKRLKKLRLSIGLSQVELATKIDMHRGMIASYECDHFYPTLDSINKLSKALDIKFLCNEGYSKFLLESSNFKDKLINWRLENNLTKRDAAKLLGISERGYGLWESGSIMSVTTYYKLEKNLIKYNLS